MKTKWVATLDAGKLKAGFQFKNYWRILFLIILMVVYSCSNDDLEAIDNDTSIEKEPPIVEQPPVNSEDPGGEPPVTYEYQVIYTDSEPDYTVGRSRDSLGLDINNDGVMDFFLRFQSNLMEDWFYIESNPDARNQVLSITPWYAHPVPLEKDTRIFNKFNSQAETFEIPSIFAVGNCSGGVGDCYANWASTGERYLGVRFSIGRTLHYYGWVRIQVLSWNSLVVMDYAYNAIANQPINAGQIE